MKRTHLFFAISMVISLLSACADEPDVTSAITDKDGNIYHAVTIGTQTWMVENLKTTRLNDGTAIPNVTDDAAWGALATPGYCWYNNNAATYKDTYGALYNGYAVTTGKLAPTGWHVPTNAEWATLQNYVNANLGTSSSLGKALAATTNWQASTYEGNMGNDLSKNNSTGFTAFPGGYRNEPAYNVEFLQIGSICNWWTTTEIVENYFNYINLGYYGNGQGFFLGTANRKNGFSVRCIKD
jgi:uncharacterized protein (TIGR02145 family)